MELSIQEQRDAIGQRWIRKLTSVLAGIAMGNTLLLVLDQFVVLQRYVNNM